LTDGMYEDADIQNKAEAVKAKLEEQIEMVSFEERRAIVKELLEYNGNKWVVKDFVSLSSELLTRIRITKNWPFSLPNI